MQKRPDPTRLTAVLFVSGGFAGLLLSLIFCWSPASVSLSFSDFIFVFLYFWVGAAIVSIPIALLAGVPSYFVLVRLGAFNALAVCFIGIGCGWLVHLADFVDLSGLTCGAIGFASAFLAWLLLSQSSQSVAHADARKAAHRLTPAFRTPWLKPSHRKIVALLVSAVALYFVVPACVLHFEMSRFLFPHTSAFTGRTTQANFSIKSRSGNELLVRRYGQAKVGCVVFFPGQHGATAAYDFASYTDAGLAVFTMAYPGQDGASGRTELSEIIGLVDHALGTVAHTCPPDRTVIAGVSLGSMLAAYASDATRPAGLVLVSAAPSLSAAIRIRFRSHWTLAPLNLLPVSKLLKHDYSLAENFRSSPATPVVIFQGTDDDQTPIELLHTPEMLRAGVRIIAVPGATHSTTFTMSKKAQLATILWMLRRGGAQAEVGDHGHF